MNNSKLQSYFLAVLLAGALLLTFFIFHPFFTPLVLATVFSVIFQPLYKNLSKRFGDRRNIAALATVLISIICVLIPLTLIGIRIVTESQHLYTSIADGSGKIYLDTILKQGEQILKQYFPEAQNISGSLSASVDTYSKQGLSWIIQNLGAAFSSIATLFLDLFIFFISLFYLLRDGAGLKKIVIELSPLPDKDDETVFDKLELAINSVVKGNLSIALIQGFLTAIGFTIFGVPNSVLWGTVAAIAALIPGFGTSLVLAPAIAFLFFTGNNMAAVGLIIWGIFAVGLVDNFLGPKLIGRGIKIHPLLVLISVLGGITFFGPLGVFLGPLTLSLLFALLSIYSYISKE